MKKPATTQVPVAEIIANRWSGRAYDPAKAVSRQQVISLLEAARWAPSCFGDQPWRFIVWDRNHDAAAWQQAFDCLVEGNQSWVRNAPVLLLVTANTLFDHNGKENRWGSYDAGAAAENLCLQAEELGLMAHQMGGFDVKKAREVFAVPEQFQLMAMISVGYAADVSTLTGDVLDRETAPRARKALGEIFFDGAWAKPVA